MRMFALARALIVLAAVLATALAPCAASVARAQPLTAEQERALKPKDVFKECDACPDMVAIPGGEFMMGARPGEETAFDTPRHSVRIKAFAVSRFEVTVGEFADFVRDSGHKPAPQCLALADLTNGYFKPREDISWRDPGFPQDRSHPVACVGWLDAKAFVAWLARKTGRPYRLLSESEWEYTARAGSVTRYPFGDSAAELCLHGNGGDRTLQRAPGGVHLADDASALTCSDAYLHTAPVGRFPANAFGLHDMLGNVLEWLEDCDAGMLDTATGYKGAPDDGSPWIAGTCKGRAARGGHWGSDSRALQSNTRSGGDPAFGGDYVGIRVARTREP